MKFMLTAGIIILSVLLTTTHIFRLGVFNDSVSNAKRISSSENYFNRLYFRINRSDISYYIQTRSCEKVENNGESESSQCVRPSVQNIPQFKMKDVVRCLDLLSVKRNRRPMHIAFIGDSTVRQHFMSFIRWIPDYDRKTVSISTTFAEYAFHEDMNVTSNLLDNLRVSFYWRNLIRSDLIADFKRWASTSDDSQAPDFILRGITAHHLIVNNKSVSNSLEKYKKLAEDELLPLLKQSLAAHPHQQIVWLQQSLTIEQLSHVVDYGIYPDKIKKYNAILLRIFKGTKVLIWDTINAIVEEYIRACTLTSYYRRDVRWYENCNDIIHPGYGALSLGTHLFINHICDFAISHEQRYPLFLKKSCNEKC